MNITKSSLVVAMAAITLLSACTSQNGGTETNVSATSQTPPTATPSEPTSTSAGAQTPVAQAAGSKGCVSADLAVTLNPLRGDGMNKNRLALTFTNRGAAECTLQGWPGVSFVTGDSGTQVGAAATREGNGGGTAVALAPGGSATSNLAISNADAFDPATCAPVDVRGLRVYPPDQKAAVFVERPGQACSAQEKSTIAVGPVQG
jgi:hypothetical protein